MNKTWKDITETYTLYIVTEQGRTLNGNRPKFVAEFIRFNEYDNMALVGPFVLLTY